MNAKDVIAVLQAARVDFVLIGAHGIAGWLRQARGTQDVDVVIKPAQKGRAIKAVAAAFPKLVKKEVFFGLTRFVDPRTDEPVIDLIHQRDHHFPLFFQNFALVKDSYKVPDLEMALVAKYAAMVSPLRELPRKLQDATDFTKMISANKDLINLEKTGRLAEAIYEGAGQDIVRDIQKTLRGEPIQL